jgi:quinol monooxygenase YgiN
MTFVMIARWRAKEGALPELEAILRELTPKIRSEPRNLEFIVNRSADDPSAFILYEQYEDEEAFRVHRETEHFKTLVLGRAVPLLAERELKVHSIFQ